MLLNSCLRLGIQRHVPSLYSACALDLQHAADRVHNTHIQFYEWEREGWSYHAKG